MPLPEVRRVEHEDGTSSWVRTPPIDLFCDRLEHEFHVHPDIIARVRRMNPDLKLNSITALRGMHRKPGRWWGLARGLIQKGEFIRLHGRAAFDRLPKYALIKNGRRVWVTHAWRRFV